jgi:hypothetical protein
MRQKGLDCAGLGGSCEESVVISEFPFPESKRANRRFALHMPSLSEVSGYERRHCVGKAQQNTGLNTGPDTGAVGMTMPPGSGFLPFSIIRISRVNAEVI